MLKISPFILIVYLYLMSNNANNEIIAELGLNFSIKCFDIEVAYWYKYEKRTNKTILIDDSSDKYSSNSSSLLIYNFNLNDIGKYYCFNDMQNYDVIDLNNIVIFTNFNQKCLISQCECSYNNWINSSNLILKLLNSMDCSNRYLTNIQEYLLDPTISDNLRLYQNITIFDFNSNLITKITADLFSYFTSLIQLDLSYNNIQTIEDLAFNDLEYLKVLELNGNLIKSINKLTFHGLSAIEQLNLRDNKISSISDDSFNFSLITDLDLSKNSIQVINVMTLNKLVNLINLDLSQNLIRIIVDYSFQSLNQLKTLILSRNRIEVIGKNTLIGLNSLEILSLNNNSLIDFDVNALYNIPNAKKINVENNPLKLTTWILFCNRNIFVPFFIEFIKNI
jgi:Leucine-rich repeat (LRR) protein